MNGKHAAHPFGIYYGTCHAKTGAVSQNLQSDARILRRCFRTLWRSWRVAWEGKFITSRKRRWMVLSVKVSDGLIATRTAGEVLYLAFGGKAAAKQGGFFPTGLNGRIILSTEAAAAAKIAA